MLPHGMRKREIWKTDMNNKMSGLANFTKAAKVLDCNKMVRFNTSCCIFISRKPQWTWTPILRFLVKSESLGNCDTHSSTETTMVMKRFSGEITRTINKNILAALIFRHHCQKPQDKPVSGNDSSPPLSFN